MSVRAERRPSAEAAEQAVKAYIRMNRERLAAEGDVLAMLLPERFAAGGVRDLQAFTIERLAADNARLKAERDALSGNRESRVRLGEGARLFLLELVDAKSFAEAIAVALAAGPAFGADRTAFCIESSEGVARTGTDGVRLIPAGTVSAVLGRDQGGQDAMGAVLSGGGELLLGAGDAQCKSVAAFRLRIGRDTPPALYVLGARAEGRFENAELEVDLRFVTRALERAIRAWLDLPRI